MQRHPFKATDREDRAWYEEAAASAQAYESTRQEIMRSLTAEMNASIDSEKQALLDPQEDEKEFLLNDLPVVSDNSRSLIDIPAVTAQLADVLLQQPEHSWRKKLPWDCPTTTMAEIEKQARASRKDLEVHNVPPPSCRCGCQLWSIALANKAGQGVVLQWQQSEFKFVTVLPYLLTVEEKKVMADYLPKHSACKQPQAGVFWSMAGAMIDSIPLRYTAEVAKARSGSSKEEVPFTEG